ncbi:MAG TPA: extradiol ring-cleavage dioxygenase [Dehalococcoidia bacterium]|nr:extradiol ring-cleavage dioxygenase [Dehalococcoidia bacterium]
MGEILGLGITHHPGLAGPDRGFAYPLRAVLEDPGLSEELRRPEGWPEPMRQEWGLDDGLAAAGRHREAIVRRLRLARRALDEFQPDFVLVWGDDQYENFREDIIPPFCVLAYDSLEMQPWASGRWGKNNIWGEPEDKRFQIKGHPAAGKFLTARLLEDGFDVCYAYKPLHHDLGHAFSNAVLFLDYERRGWPYPLLPFQVNCYGRNVIASKGFLRGLAEPEGEGELDPPSPAPWRCIDLGRAIARSLAESPWRVALVASSSWSHANLTRKNHYLHPDVEADRELFAALREGDYERWRERPLAALEESGQHEVLNWYCLLGAMAELGRKPDEAELVESWIFNSDKCFAIFRP